ncbi:MAG: transglutaminase-like domain-containing protein [Nitrospinota bacterium]
MPLTDAQLKAICQLLEDGQPAVAAALDRQVAGFTDADRDRLLARLRREGPARAVLPPSLEDHHHEALERAFSEWAVSTPGEGDLERGSFLLAMYGFPLEDMRRRGAGLDRMAAALRDRLEGADSPAEVVERTAEYLHGELRFDGERENYYDPQNSYLNRVIERRRGIPITLSVLYLLMGQRLGLPFRGVGMPGHFIVKYEAPEGPIFLDPFDRGRRLGVEDCASIVRGLGYHFDPHFLQETPPRRIVERMVNNLIGIFQREGEERQMRRLMRYREIVQRG